MSRSALSSGFAREATFAPASAMTSSVSRLPTSTSPPFVTTGRDATAPSTIRASSTVPSGAVRTAAATPSTGKSNAPRRRSFQ
jgi:hypothetical protein